MKDKNVTQNEEKQDLKVKNKEAKLELKATKKAVKEEAKKEKKAAKADDKAKKNIDSEVKKATMPNDKIIIGSIVGAVIFIALTVFGIYFYNTNLKAVAKFDGGNLSVADFTVYYKTFAPMLEYYGYPANIIPEQIANKATIDKIMLMLAKKENVTITKENMETVNTIFNDKKQVQSFIDSGIDPTQMKQLYIDDYTISAYIDYLKSKLSDEKVAEYIHKTYGEDADMREYVTRHMLFMTVGSDGKALSDDEIAKAKTNAEAALARLNNGEDFSTLAKEVSEDTGTAKNGGLYKVYMDEKTVAEYQNAATSLEVGKYTTSLVKSSYGYHIILLEEYNENGRTHSDTDREAIVSSDLDTYFKTYNGKIDTAMLTKVVENITGKKASDEEVDVYTEKE